VRALVLGSASSAARARLRSPAPRGGSLLRGLLVSALLLGPAACARVEPPGRHESDAYELTLPPPVAEPEPSATPSEPVDAARYEPSESHKLASIAMRTWIYDAPRDRSNKLGYLRAGALVGRSELSHGTSGCEGGWYRVVPRGFACVGKGASLSLEHPIVQAAPRGPRRGEPLPYDYVMSANPPPHLYFKLPSEADQERTEGKGYFARAKERKGLLDALTLDAVPAFLLAGNSLPQPYGSEKNLAYSVHRGRARANSAFGLMAVFEWTERRFGLATELDLIPLDRTKPAKQSQLRGVELREGGRPAIVVGGGTTLYRREGDRLVARGSAPGRSGWELTGANEGGERGLLETTEGAWLPAPGLILPPLEKDRAGFAEKGRKWISVSIEKQVLVAYEGERPVYAALVSTGRGGMSDPKETFATVRGTFMIRAKHVSGTMDGEESSDEAFDLRDVPYIQYFHEGYALHAAYWHDDFGKVRSHGCVNLTPTDAAWLFDWTDPEVPRDWHGAVSPQGGTLVWIHR
jgi:hypothetical protein